MPRDRFIDIGAVHTRYWQEGAAGTPVLLLHGIGCSVLEWTRNVEALASRHVVFAVDLMGFGLTDKPGGEDYSLARLARFALDFMTAVGVPRAHLAGNSLGGRLALECAITEPARVASLLLVDPAGVDGPDTLLEFRLATIPLLGELLTRPNATGTRMLWRKAFADPEPFVTDEMVQTKLALARLPGAHAAFLKTLRGFVGPRGFRPQPLASLHAALPRIQAPALAIWGREDRFVPPAHAGALQRLLPGVQVELWDACGHAPQIECAARFNEAAMDFWQRADA
jgi:pimeloyl-ACP methyl ester carboxylesterase